MRKKITRTYIPVIFGASALVFSQSLAQSETLDSNSSTVPGVDVSFFADGRLRFQTIDQDNFTSDAEALTVRVQGGAEVEVSTLFSALVELEGSYQIIDDFNDTLNGQIDRPVIPDVETLELNRLQLQTELIPKTRVTLGRQSVALDNWRFLGHWDFRQNDQTFDALRVETSIGRGRLNLGYFNKVHRQLGDDSPVGEFSGDSYIVNYSHPSPIGQISLFHYALDLGISIPDASIHTFSNVTTGVRWHGRRNWRDFGLAWDASVAQQSDFADNPNEYKAYYLDFGLETSLKNFELSLGVESLGSDNGVSVQTPLGSLHNFQGVTDRFFLTPVDGLTDYHAGLNIDLGDHGPFERIELSAGFHRFNASQNDRNYGRELNFGLSGKVDAVTLKFEYGDYNSRALPSDFGLFANDANTAIFSASYSFD